MRDISQTVGHRQSKSYVIDAVRVRLLQGRSCQPSGMFSLPLIAHILMLIASIENRP